VIEPRPYQEEALEALDAHMRAKESNPCVVIPTGGGKSLMIAWAIQRWKQDYPPFRCMILAHRKELVRQNADELMALWPFGDVGIYSAGLRQRDLDNSVTYASIDSVHKRWGEFPPFDVLVIDEAHRIPAKGEGKYRGFIQGCKSQSPDLRVVGFTATPFRMGMGAICHGDHILNEVCYEAHVGSLISDGFLCGLRSKVGIGPDLNGVRRNGKGDYVAKSLAEAVDVPDVVRTAVRNAMAIIQAEKRKSVVFFCVDVSHCRAVSMELRRHGLEAPVVTAKTKRHERDRIAEGFKQGRYRAICNVNVYTEGFNAKRVDCIVLLRPTLSAGLYAQMVGRGLRLHPSKTDCLVLDFARCIETHGPVDYLQATAVRVIVCGSVAPPKCKLSCGNDEGCTECGGSGYEPWWDGCGDTFSRALGACPHCGWKIPPLEIARAEAEERERKMHEEKAAQRAILGSEPEELVVNSVTVHRHRKPGMPDSVRVQYRCGVSTFREWICLDHDGFAAKKARRWWARRFGIEEARTATVDRAVDDLFTATELASLTETITVVRRGRHSEIVGYKLRKPGGDSGAT
jgi:DNA repair protein RadD